MIVNPRRFFVIVGNPHTGKRKTTQQLFGRQMFLPFKGPIKTPALGDEQFVIIFPRSPDSQAYLAYIRSLIQQHRDSDTSFFVILDLASGEDIGRVRCILEYFNQSRFDVHYLLLSSSLYDQHLLSNEVIGLLREKVRGTVHVLDKIVTGSLTRFNERAADVGMLISKVLETRYAYL